jgi:LPPG:FO 2-phospho-L-lactate transferase
MIHAFSGGVGGAKLARGLVDVVPAHDLAIVVNTGDDFDYLGLRIMPDFDSVAYAMAGLNDEQRGWGRADETWHCKDSLASLGVDTWFSLGDRDLATHLLRFSLLKEGVSTTEACARMAQAMGIACTLAPMTDAPVSTMVLTTEGELSFQDYFVRRGCAPKVNDFRFAGVDRATPSAAWFSSLVPGWTDGVLLCPSNPYVSIDPILALAGVRERLRQLPVVAVSPVIAGASVKGPLAKMLREMGWPCTPVAIAEHYRDFLDGIVIDARDAAHEPELRRLGFRVAICDTLMKNREVSCELARTSLQLLAECGATHAA